MAVHVRQCGGVERHRAGEPRHRQSVPDVVRRLVGRQRVEVVARDHPLRQLLHAGLGEPVAQLRLPDQHDLQQLVGVGLEVGQQAQLLQHVRRQVLRLVDHEQAVAAGGVALQQELVQRVDVVLHRAQGRHGDSELVAHRLQQLGHRQLGVEDVGHVGALGHLAEEAAADGGLAGAHRPREQHEAAPASDAIEQVRQRLPMTPAHVEEARVGRDREGILLQAEQRRVHARSIPTTLRRARVPAPTTDRASARAAARWPGRSAGRAGAAPTWRSTAWSRVAPGPWRARSVAP